MESLDSGHPTVKQKTASRVSVKARTLAHESYCGELGWLQLCTGNLHWHTRQGALARHPILRHSVMGWLSWHYKEVLTWPITSMPPLDLSLFQ